MIKKQKLGQFFTSNSDYIVGDLVSFIPNNVYVVDPFAGNWDLLRLSKNICLGFDVDPKNEKTIKQDTLLNPPGYDGYWILTNPPYLARNKTKNKKIYDRYGVDDLYKAALYSIGSAAGGIIIIPLNFFSSKDAKTRIDFLSRFNILYLKIFEEQVFLDTSYTVCAFVFKAGGLETQSFPVRILPSNQEMGLEISAIDGFRIGTEFFECLSDKADVKISRLLVGQKPNSKIFLRALDTGSMNGRISLSMSDEPFFGKNTDRAFATLRFSKNFTIKEQELIVEEFNKLLEKYRKKYNSLFLSNFRNSTTSYARKRMSFDDAYDFVGHIIKKLEL